METTRQARTRPIDPLSFVDPAAVAEASDRYAWMLSKDGPGEDEEHVVEAIVAEWKAARAAFDFTTEEPSA